MILTFAAPQIAVFALQFGPLETCALILMGLTCISSVSANNQFKGLAMGVLGLLLAGRSAPYIAEQLCVSQNTVKTHVRHIYAKLDIHTRQELLDLVQEQEA